MNELHLQHLVTLFRPSSWKKSDAEQGSAVSCSDYLFLVGRLHCGELQTLTEQIFSLPGSLLFASHLEVLSCSFSFNFCALSRVIFRVLNFLR